MVPPMPLEDNTAEMQSSALPASRSAVVNDVSTTIDSINAVLERMQTWRATLPFVGIEGRGDEPIDLFEFVEPKTIEYIIFNRNLYPPNNDGLSKLMSDLKRKAILNGTNLINRYKKNELRCFRCRTYSRKSGEEKKISSSQSFDEFGVMIGMRNHTWRNNRNNNRASGRQKSKSTKTTLPVSDAQRCNVQLTVELLDG